MSHRYIPKQPIVEAFQLIKENWEKEKDWPWWFRDEVKKGFNQQAFGIRLERTWVDWNSWIVTRFYIGNKYNSWEIFSEKDFENNFSFYPGQLGSLGAREE